MASDPDLRHRIDRELDLLEQLGPRLTGNASHVRLVEHVDGQLRELGLTTHLDRHTLTRWDAQPPTLTIDGVAVEVASAFPYSGATGPSGVTAPAASLTGVLPRWSRARDRIAVVPVLNQDLPLGRLVDVWPGSEPWPAAANPLLPATLAGLGLARARKAGVRGVVFAWQGLAPGNAATQYVPFTLPYQDLPAVFVAGDAADRAIAAGRAGSTLQLALDATLVPDVATHTAWALVEGTEQPDETVLVVTHSDGTNVVEENGHIALVELARQVRERPCRRTVVFVLSTGHLRLPEITAKGQATTRWLDDHRELWSPRHGRHAVAGLVVEHLGAREFADDPAHTTYGPTGRAEPEVVYATTPALAEVVATEWAAGADRLRVSRPGPFIQFGEGEPLRDAGIPAISFITMPQYLLATRAADYVDHDLFARQIDGFGRLLRRMDQMPASSFGSVVAPSPVAKAKAAAPLLVDLLRSRRRARRRG